MSTNEENNDDNLMQLSSDESVQDLDQPKIFKERKAKNKVKKKGIELDSSGGKRKKSSTVWDHFEIISGDVNHAKCIYCTKQITCSARNETNAMKRPTDSCKKAPFNIDKRQTILDFESKTRVNDDGTIETVSIPKLWHFNQDEIRKALAKMLIVDELPFSSVEREGFRHFCKVAIPDFVPISRSTITRDCYGLYIEKRKQLKNFFRNLSSRVCLTTDCWTSGQNLSYMCLTAHFIDDNWKLNKRIINFYPVGGHSGELIGKTVEKCLLGWGLKRVLTVTVDNASSNNLAIQYLKKIFHLWYGSVMNSDFLHMRCAAHILNLVVRDGLKDVDISILKVRAAVEYVRSSPSRLEKFKSCVEEENIQSKGLVSLDVGTRWNSTYLMLKTALVFRKAIKNMKTKFAPYVRELRKVGGVPDEEDWDKVACFLAFLEVFYEATLKLSGSRYVTGITLVEDIYDIGYEISDYLNDEDDGLKKMAKQMKLKFDKYWSNAGNVNVLMFIACVLDPRHKLNYVKWIVRRSYDTSNSYILCQRIRDALSTLFDSYALSQPSSRHMGSSSLASTSTIHESGGKGCKKSRLRNDYVRENGNLNAHDTKTELEKYLEDKIEPDDDNFEILDWWATQSNRYPILMKMARDVLAIPVSTVASESAFSTRGRVLDSFRTSLTPRMVEGLICAQDWMHTSYEPINIEESLIELENMEEGMKDLVLEQPTIMIDETMDISDLTSDA